jgi:hypothetical protein
MSPIAAFRDGIARVAHARWLVVGLWGVTVLMTLPLAWLLRHDLAQHLGASLTAEAVASGVNFDWWNEFLAQASGLSQTFVPAVVGFAAVLKNVSGVADAEALALPIALVVAGHTLLSIFLMGGVLDRLARDRATASYGFFSACGLFFFRFLRLAMIAAIVYWVLFTSVHPLLFGTAWTWLTRDLAVERTAAIYRLLLYLLFAAVLMLINLWFDYAKVRMVVEDRRSAIGALAAAFRFVERQPAAALSLYLLNVAAFVTVLALYAVVAPGVSGGVAAVAGFLLAQIYIALRVAVRLLFAASQIALFQGRLAHAGYTAVFKPVWPDSPAAEAIKHS